MQIVELVRIHIFFKFVGSALRKDWPKVGKTYFFVIFPQKRQFLGGKRWKIFLFFFKLCCSRISNYVSITKKIINHHISNNFLQFSKRWSKNKKKVQLLNLSKPPFYQFSLDINFFTPYTLTLHPSSLLV